MKYFIIIGALLAILSLTTNALPQFQQQQQQFPQFQQQFPQFSQFPDQQQQQQFPTQFQAQPQTQTTASPILTTIGSDSTVSTTTPAPAVTTQSPMFISCLANCPTTSEYNPVCGSDSTSYSNRQKLDCANFCGPRVNTNWTPVQQLRRGACTAL